MLWAFIVLFLVRPIRFIANRHLATMRMCVLFDALLGCKANISLQLRKTPSWEMINRAKADLPINSRTVKIHNLKLLAFHFEQTNASCDHECSGISLQTIVIVNFIEVIVCMRSFTNCHINTKFTCIKDYNLSTHNFPITHRGIRFALAPFLIIVISQRLPSIDEEETKNTSVNSFSISFFLFPENRLDYNISCVPRCPRANESTSFCCLCNSRQ